MKSHQLLYTRIYLSLFAIGILFLFLIDKGQMVYLINGIHTPFLDILFKYVTYIGDGILFVPLIILLLFIKYRYAIIATIIAIGHGLILSFLKKIIFKGAPRPTAYLEDQSMLHFVEGVKVHTNNAFPSGHTATAFAFCLLITFILPKKWWGVPLLIVAVLAGCSRIYLLQHFYIDVVVGGLIGSLVTILTWYYLYNKNLPLWADHKIKLK